MVHADRIKELQLALERLTNTWAYHCREFIAADAFSVHAINLWPIPMRLIVRAWAEMDFLVEQIAEFERQMEILKIRIAMLKERGEDLAEGEGDEVIVVERRERRV